MQCAFLLFHPIEGEGGGCSAAGAALIVQLFALLPIKGGVLFPKRIPPLEPPEKGEGRPPRPPTLRALGLKDCTRCAVEVQCTWLRHGSSASRYRQQPRPTPWGACDGGSAADCGAGGGIASLAAAGGCPSIIKKRPRQRSFSCSFRSSRAERTAATTNAENVQSLPRITSSISSSISLGKRTDLLVVGGTLGILKAIVLTCNTIYMTSVLHNARNMCTINV